MNAVNNVLGLSKSFESRLGFKSKKLGFSQLEGSKPEDLILESTFLQTKLLTSVKIYHGYALDGLEFCYEDGHSQLFGTRGGKPGGDEFLLGRFFSQCSGSILTNVARHPSRRDNSWFLRTGWALD